MVAMLYAHQTAVHPTLVPHWGQRLLRTECDAGCQIIGKKCEKNNQVQIVINLGRQDGTWQWDIPDPLLGSVFWASRLRCQLLIAVRVVCTSLSP